MDLQATSPGNSALPSLSPDPREVERILGQVRLRDRATLSSFGEEAQKGVTAYSDTVLRQVMSKDAGPVGALLTDMLTKAKGVDPTELASLGLMDRLRGGITTKMMRFKEGFSTVQGQVERIQEELERQVGKLKRDIALLDGLYDRNVERMVHLEAYIIAGNRALEIARERDLPNLRNRAQAAGDGVEGQLLAQEASDLSQAMERFERRIHDLKLSRMLAMQRLPQIRLVQNGDATLVDKLVSGIANAIPAWKDGMVIAFGLHNQAGATKAADAVDETTDAMVRRNADMMRANAVAIEKAAQRGMVSVETLAHVNRQFIGTIQDVLSVQRDGKVERDKAGDELVRIERELRDTLTGISA